MSFAFVPMRDFKVWIHPISDKTIESIHKNLKIEKFIEEMELPKH